MYYGTVYQLSYKMCALIFPCFNSYYLCLLHINMDILYKTYITNTNFTIRSKTYNV